MDDDVLPLVTMRNITKRFGGSQVVSNADLILQPGRLHALLGPNGAGKSTLIKMLSGVYRVDGGSIQSRGRDGATAARIAFVHQNLALVDDLTVRENLYLERAGSAIFAGVINKKAEHRAAMSSLAAVKTDVDPETPLGDLSLGQKTLVAVARLLNSDVDVIVLDETSAALTRRESDWLYAEARRFADGGGAVLAVTHRLGEVVKHCDHATVMTDGRVTFEGPMPGLDALHSMMARGLTSEPPVRQNASGREVVVRLSSAGTDAIHPGDLEVRSGEVLALVGPLSSRLYEIGHLIAGRSAATSGQVEVVGTAAFVPEHCQNQALLPGLSVRENMTIGYLKRFSKLGRVARRAEDLEVSQQITALDIQPPAPEASVSELSGGNQQKVMMARAALGNPHCYILCEPTRGVDVKTRHAIYRFIQKVSAEGAAVVIITIDVDDAYAVAHRIGLVRTGGVIDSIHLRGEMSVARILEEVDA
jgi:ribose transport system ATP-binding protein